MPQQFTWAISPCAEAGHKIIIKKKNLKIANER